MLYIVIGEARVSQKIKKKSTESKNEKRGFHCLEFSDSNPIWEKEKNAQSTADFIKTTNTSGNMDT